MKYAHTNTAARRTKNNAMRKVKFDVMLKGRYVCTMSYEYCPLFAIQIEDLCAYIVSKRPSLKNKPFNIVF